MRPWFSWVSQSLVAADIQRMPTMPVPNGRARAAAMKLCAGKEQGMVITLPGHVHRVQ